MQDFTINQDNLCHISKYLSEGNNYKLFLGNDYFLKYFSPYWIPKSSTFEWSKKWGSLLMTGLFSLGGQKRQEFRPRFRGSPPGKIQDHLKESFKFLRRENEEKALENALHFYQKFVFTHPFYDGNGRIARLFVNMYLYQFGLYINWKNLQDKGSFLKKLNYYHETNIEKHFGWWVQICEKEVFEISEEDEESE